MNCQKYDIVKNALTKLLAEFIYFSDGPDGFNTQLRENYSSIFKTVEDIGVHNFFQKNHISQIQKKIFGTSTFFLYI